MASPPPVPVMVRVPSMSVNESSRRDSRFWMTIRALPGPSKHRSRGQVGVNGCADRAGSGRAVIPFDIEPSGAHLFSDRVHLRVRQWRDVFLCSVAGDGVDLYELDLATLLFQIDQALNVRTDLLIG